MEINSSKKKKKKFEDEYKILEELLISKKVKIYKVQSKKDRLTCRMMHSIQKTSFCNLNDDKIMSKEFELLFLNYKFLRRMKYKPTWLLRIIYFLYN